MTAAETVIQTTQEAPCKPVVETCRLLDTGLPPVWARPGQARPGPHPHRQSLPQPHGPWLRAWRDDRQPGVRARPTGLAAEDMFRQRANHQQLGDFSEQVPQQLHKGSSLFSHSPSSGLHEWALPRMTSHCDEALGEHRAPHANSKSACGLKCQCALEFKIYQLRE